MTDDDNDFKTPEYFREIMLEALRKGYALNVPAPITDDWVSIPSYMAGCANVETCGLHLREAVVSAFNNRPEAAIDALLHFGHAVADQFGLDCYRAEVAFRRAEKKARRPGQPMPDGIE